MLAKYKINLEETTPVQYVIVALTALVYLGIFLIPLIDNDAAHHANIAMHMYLTGDYHSLIDRGMPYLDKPHFLFWVAAFSFKLFGVTTFAYRLPAVLFAIVSVVSVYKLTKHLSDITTAKLAAIILATAQAFIFSIIDARMEAPLTAAIAFGLWQLTVYIDNQKFSNLLGAAAGAAIAFDTKGWIGPAVIFISGFIKLWLDKKWYVIGKLKTWLFVPLFLLFISPVLYSYYLQYDLDPEIKIRGMSGISGVAFILWNQSFERFGGDNFAKGGRHSSPFFLYHTFLWAFAPWCILAYVGVWYWLRRLWYNKKRHAFTYIALSFALILFAVSFSKFKMPHYVLILFPLAAMLTAPYLRLALSTHLIKFFYPLQVVLGYLVLIATGLLNFYFFKPLHELVAIVGIGLMITFFILLTFKDPKRAVKVVYVSVMLSLTLNFFMSFNFFPNLMHYQGGNELGIAFREHKPPFTNADIKLVDADSHSFDFYTAQNHDVYDLDSLMTHYTPLLRETRFLLTTEMKRKLEANGFSVQPELTHINYQVSKVQLKFLNERTRTASCDSLMLARIEKR